MLLLPDCSEYQANASMSGIRSLNGGAAIIRVAYGASHPDTVFARLRAAASNYAFLGLYHFVTPDEDAAAQAKEFLRLVGRLAPHEVPILDLEEGDGNQAPRANTWLALVDNGLGLVTRPLNERSWLYSGEDFAQTHGLGQIFASPRHTWVAAYGPNEPSIGHTLWQCTNGVLGVNRQDWPGAGYCDTSVYHGTLTQLAALSSRYQPAAPSGPVTWTSAASVTLAQLCALRKTSPAAVLEHTAQDHGFAPATAQWLDAVLTGTLSPAAVVPAGVTLTLPF